MKPSVLRQRNGIQLTYDLPAPIYDTHVYPRQSSSGSTVIVYGHDSGLRAVWYAGKRFKSQTDPPTKVNGNAKDDPVVIDLDDDDEPPPSNAASASAEFEQEEDEVDPSHPYHDVLRHIDIPLGTAALRLAIPYLPPALSDSAAYPSLLRDYAVVAVACADLGIRLVVLPLQPPAPGISDPSKAGVQIDKLSGSGFHQDLISSIALTPTANSDDSGDEGDPAQDQSQKWSFLVASTSCTGSGLLLVHQVPIRGNRLSTDGNDAIPIRRQHLRLPLMSAELSFNTSPYPAERHSTLLIALPDASCVKLYQVFPRTTFTRNRRGSVGTTDSASSTRSTPALNSNHGKFLITLLPEFSLSNSMDPNQRRKSVLDAKWILGGRAIIALLQGGEWGVWDLEAAGPVSSASNQNLIKGQGNVSGIIGGSWTRFAIKGTLSSLPAASNPKKDASTPSGGLVAATPHTRRMQAQGLFQGGHDAIKHSNLDQSGNISVASSKDSSNDESIIINYGNQNVYIPSAVSYWKSDATGKGGFASSGGNSTVLPSIRTGGENIKSISLLPAFPKQQSALFGARTYPNFLASTAVRLILFVSLLAESPEDEDTSSALTGPISVSLETTDQSLLQQGALDVDGMDRILNDMDSPVQTRFKTTGITSAKPKPNFGKSIGFAQDVDMDMTPDMPSPTTTSKLQTSRSKETERRLFS